MSERYTRPDWARRIIAMGESVGGRVEGARRLIPLDADSLVTQALDSRDAKFGDYRTQKNKDED